MFAKKFTFKNKLKNRLRKAFKMKQRTRKEVDQDYSQEALLLGHKSRVLAQLHQEVERQEKEIKSHLDKLLVLNQEGMKLPPEDQQAPIPLHPETKELEKKEVNLT